jgi:hypothetical protein
MDWLGVGVGKMGNGEGTYLAFRTSNNDTVSKL